MAGNQKQYGAFSQRAADQGVKVGIWLAADEREVTCTAVSPDSAFPNSGFSDSVARGEVVKWLRDASSRRTYS